MKKLLLLMMLFCMALAYFGCKKDNNRVKPSSYHPNVNLATAKDSSGGENPPIPPNP